MAALTVAAAAAAEIFDDDVLDMSLVSQVVIVRLAHWVHWDYHSESTTLKGKGKRSEYLL